MGRCCSIGSAQHYVVTHFADTTEAMLPCSSRRTSRDGDEVVLKGVEGWWLCDR